MRTKKKMSSKQMEKKKSKRRSERCLAIDVCVRTDETTFSSDDPVLLLDFD